MLLWTDQIQIIYKKDGDKAIDIISKVIDILIATSISVKLGIIGIRGYIKDIQAYNNTGLNYFFILEKRIEQNLYIVELYAIVTTLEYILSEINYKWIFIFSSNRSALIAIS